MRINARVLGWPDRCCGCIKIIPSTDKVFMISEIGGVPGSIHLCKSCIDKIIESKEDTEQ